MRQQTYYEILGVSQKARYAEIKKAYRELAKRHHPDKNPHPSEDTHRHFSEIVKAYAILSNLYRRRSYDQILMGSQSPSSLPYWQSHYSGYPYFRYDIFTPFFNKFFMGGKFSGKTKQERNRTIFLNWRTLAISIFGALLFFKFFSSMIGVVVDKSIDAGWFHNISYYLILKTGAGKENKKRVRSAIYEQVQRNDQLEKAFFSFNYLLNGEKNLVVTPTRFFIRVLLIYSFITGGLFLLERSRK